MVLFNLHFKMCRIIIVLYLYDFAPIKSPSVACLWATDVVLPIQCVVDLLMMCSCVKSNFFVTSLLCEHKLIAFKLLKLLYSTYKIHCSYNLCIYLKSLVVICYFLSKCWNQLFIILPYLTEAMTNDFRKTWKESRSNYTLGNTQYTQYT